MRNSVRLPLLLAALLAGATACVSVQNETEPAAEPPGGLSAEDIHEIEELVQGYTRGIDVGPEDASWVFAPDAVFEYTAGAVQGGRVEGADELKAFYANLRETNTTRHVLSNLVIEPSPGGATGSVYMTSFDRAGDAPIAVTALGMYEDEYARTDAGWRIRHRVYTQLLPPPGEQ